MLVILCKSPPNPLRALAKTAAVDTPNEFIIVHLKKFVGITK